MPASGPTWVSESNIRNRRAPSAASLCVAEITPFEFLLLGVAFAVGGCLGRRIRLVAAAGDEIVPGLRALRLERFHEVPQRGPGDGVGKAGIPGDVDAKREMLVEAEIAAELAAHKGKRPLDHGARRFDLVYRVRGLELHPIDSGLLAVSLQPRDRVVERATGGVASVTLRHHHEIRVERVLHVDRSAVAD